MLGIAERIRLVNKNYHYGKIYLEQLLLGASGAGTQQKLSQLTCLTSMHQPRNRLQDGDEHNCCCSMAMSICDGKLTCTRASQGIFC